MSQFLVPNVTGSSYSGLLLAPRACKPLDFPPHVRIDIELVPSFFAVPAQGIYPLPRRPDDRKHSVLGGRGTPTAVQNVSHCAQG